MCWGRVFGNGWESGCWDAILKGSTITRLPDGKLGKLRIYKLLGTTCLHQMSPLASAGTGVIPYPFWCPGLGRSEWRLVVSPFVLIKAVRPSSSRTEFQNGWMLDGLMWFP